MSDGNVTYLGKNEEGQRTYDCPLCDGHIKIVQDTFYGQCDKCKMTLIDYEPAEHQEEFHKSNSRYRAAVGGYGTGKTTMSCAEVAQHMLSVPNGKTLITSQVLTQVQEAVIPELLKFIPPWFLKGKPKTHPNYNFTLTNGHKLVVFASDDSEKLRSLNLSCFYIEEASGIDVTIFHELQARLRRREGYLVDEDTGKIVRDDLLGIICSNPEQGWLVDDFILLSDTIYTSKSVDRTEYEALNYNKQKGFASFLSSSRDNLYLPPGWVDQICAGKTRQWIDKYIDCKISSKEGAIYPMFPQSLVDDFPIPKHWKIVTGYDPGYNDPTSVLFGAVDPKDGVIYFFDEYYKRFRTIPENMVDLKPKWDAYFDRLLMPIVGDPSIKKRSEVTGQSHQAMVMTHSGHYIHPGNNNITTGLDKVRLYMQLGKVKFFKSLVNIKDEATKYVTTDTGKDKEKPKDGLEDHLLDVLRYIIMELPDNPLDFTGEMFSRIDDERTAQEETEGMEDDGMYYVN